MTALPSMAGVREDALSQLRPPAAPLVACDPYFSIWSPADKLNESDTTHWTGRPHRLSSTVSIDGVPYRIMGGNSVPGAALPQKSLSVLPTRTIYSFEGAGRDCARARRGEWVCRHLSSKEFST